MAQAPPPDIPSTHGLKTTADYEEGRTSTCAKKVKEGARRKKESTDEVGDTSYVAFGEYGGGGLEAAMGRGGEG